MSFTEDEKRRWLEARRLGIEYADGNDDEYYEEVVSAHGGEAAESDDADLEASENFTHCVHCGIAISEGALCAACE